MTKASNQRVRWMSTLWNLHGRGIVLGVGIATAACGARTQSEVGGKTSWLSACEGDADCRRLEGARCVQNLCTVECESGGCGSIEGTQCAPKQEGCFEAAACLPRCSEPSDCRPFGSNYGCVDGACVLDSCVAVGAPDGAVSEQTRGPDETSGGTSETAPSSGGTSGPTDGSEVGGSPTTSGEGTRTVDSNSTMSMPPEAGVSLVDCAAVLRTAPSARPYAAELEESALGGLEGEPACEGGCGYFSAYDADWNFEWRYAPELVCPLDISACAELQAELDAALPRCNTVDDCLSYSGSLALCEPVFDSPRYFDSALFTDQERTAREAIYREMRQRGCRRLFDGWDGPTAEVVCIDNECQLGLGESCGGIPDDETTGAACDACVPDAGL